MSELTLEESAPAPVFVDESGLRGRLLRGFGWPVSLVGAMLAAAMGSSLIGVQSDAPAMKVPAQPSLSPPALPSPSLAPSASSPSPRAATRSETPHAKGSATPSHTATTTAPHRATPSDRPTKHA